MAKSWLKRWKALFLVTMMMLCGLGIGTVSAEGEHIIPSADPNYQEITLEEFKEQYPDYEGIPDPRDEPATFAISDPGYVTSKYTGPFVWKSENSKWYLYAQSGATKVTSGGWYKDGASWYLVYPVGVKMYNGQISTGEMLVGWEKIGAEWYYFNGGGVMQQDWYGIQNKWYYLRCPTIAARDGKPTGAMVLGASFLPVSVGQTTPTKNYYFDVNGVMQEWFFPMPTSPVSGVPIESYEPYYVISPFAEYRTIDGRLNIHNGIDLRAKVPINIYSATRGDVILSQMTSSMGELVVIKSDVTAPNGNPLYVRYMHMSARNVSESSYNISAGTFLGKTGDTGEVSAHFHMDVNALKITIGEVTALNGQNPAAFYTTKNWVNKTNPYDENANGYMD